MENEKLTLPDSAKETVDRRTWMSWVGKAMVLSLGGGLLARCRGPGTGLASIGQGAPSNPIEGGVEGGDVWRRGEDAGDDASAPLPDHCPDPPEKGLAFAPNDGVSVLYEAWPVRTVDRQDLESILATWQLTVDGMVSSPTVLSFAELLEMPRQNQISDFHCVEGWSVYDVPWNGVHLSDIFRLVVPEEGATHVTFHTIDGRYNESLPMDVALEPMTLIAYGICESTLPVDHGFPLRLVVPRMLAYKSAKYVSRIELTDTPVEGYWVSRGYPYDAPVRASRLREGRY
jgi:DMSO/TMAO reductase YedYZ molybdopterin-dependent catalytic subunit